MDLESLIASAQQQGASDLHLEAGFPPALRIRGSLRTAGEPIPGATLLAFARALIGDANWPGFLQRRSADFSRSISGARCRIHVLQSARGIGFAIRLLSAAQVTVEQLNLHPDLKKLTTHQHGLILISGPTGSGKSSTLAALIQEINLRDTRHIVTIESPVEYHFRPRKAYIRQREVGRDTPSFEQGLLDALRQDPDVVMVGEMRDPETMRLTLSASETGHLVLATVHSSTCAEALQRVAGAFPAEIQNAVCAQLADCLVAVVSQRLHFRSDIHLRVPECEVLIATHAVRNFIRNREFFKIISAIETGADHGMWSFQRYRQWLDQRKQWHRGEVSEAPEADMPDVAPVLESASAPASLPPPSPKVVEPGATRIEPARGGRIEIEPEEGGLERILKKLE
ncbi:MAG TPA: PilT/PilU family type 4a pilus ATPase [Verrucomicrobiae bacterium]|nr:PilT/PilU family type 4a pilus ATPase [Verrucomicrobiae bacterium]